MTHKCVGLLSVVLLSAVVGCGNERPPGANMGDVDGGGIGGFGTGGSGGGVVPADCMDAAGPTVTVGMPLGVASPNDPGVILTESINVECSVMQNGTLVDTDRVAITLTGDEPMPAEPTSPVRISVSPTVTQSTSTTESYLATANLSGFGNGLIEVACAGFDTAESPLCNSATVSTFLDLGPQIVITNPAPDAILPPGTTTFQYSITEDDLGSGDTMSGLVSEEFVVAGATITSGPAVPGDRSTMVNLSDPMMVGSVLNGTFEFSVTATNQRGASRTVSQTFTVDAEGPNIAFQMPVDGSLISGSTDVVVTVTDEASGVNDQTVTMLIEVNGVMEAPVLMSRVPGSANQFTARFDANQYPSTVTEVIVNVQATDLVGNTSSRSQSAKLDSTPPVAELDPMELVESKLVTGDMGEEFQCSTPFDPVGGDSISDREIAGTAPELRARVEDFANSVVGGNGVVISTAGLDGNSVQVYISQDVGTPLTIDTDGDTICDSINPNLAAAPTVVDLVGIPPAGSSFFNETEDFSGGPFAGCAPGDDTGSPDLICDPSASSELTRVIAGRSPPGSTTIFAKRPVGALRCVGDFWDWQANEFDPGWVCAAVVAKDNLGNKTVSPVIRFCIDDEDGFSTICGGPYGSLGTVPSAVTCRGFENTPTPCFAANFNDLGNRVLDID